MRGLTSFGVLVVLGLPVLFSGCAHFEARPLNAEASAAKLTSRRLSAGTWTLRRLTDFALKNHPDIAVARAKYETALAAVRTAGERPNPTMTVAPQFASPLIEGTYSIDFDWTLETAGKRNKRILVAKAQAQAAAANLVDAVWKIRAAVRKACLEYYAAEQKLKVVNDAIAQQGELLQAFDERIKAGAESRTVTLQARLLQAQMRLQAAEATKAQTVARANLAQALAISEKGLEGATLDFKAFGSDTSATPSIRNALTHRADVLASLAEYAASEATLRLEIAKQYPDVHLNPGYAYDGGVNKWTIGFGLSLPILNQNQGPIGEAEAKRKEAAANFKSVQAKVLAEYEVAAATLKAARTKLATTDGLLNEQAQQVASEERLIKAGSGDRTALLAAKVERATTQASRVDAMAEVQAAIGALEDATQTPPAK